jgi:lactoylglutathione lyase
MRSEDAGALSMRIEHVAVWTRDLDRLRSFYQTYFSATAGPRYASARRPFESVFLSFPGGARLELMRLPELADPDRRREAVGLAHIAFSTGSRQAVDALTARLRADGYEIVDGPRVTGDGYYESAVLDPDGNHLEITV